MATHRRTAESGPDFYSTPAWGTRALLARESFVGSIIEPCCGSGEMSEVLKETGLPIHSWDLYDRGYGQIGIDFLEAKTSFVDNIITNPPFSLAEEMLEVALKLASRKVCFLLRTAFLEGSGRYRRLYSKNPPSRIHVFSERLSMYPSGHNQENGGTTCYAWFVWDRECEHEGTIIRWIEPGWKPKNTRKIRTDPLDTSHLSGVT